MVRKISDMIHIAYVRQKEAMGLGHAVLMARELVGDEPFAVILADDIIDCRSALPQADDRRLQRNRLLRAGDAGSRWRCHLFLRRARCQTAAG